MSVPVKFVQRRPLAPTHTLRLVASASCHTFQLVKTTVSSSGLSPSASHEYPSLNIQSLAKSSPNPLSVAYPGLAHDCCHNTLA